MYYIGFDLGDGESCITCSNERNSVPSAIPVSGRNSFLSAVGYIGNAVVIGELARNSEVSDLRVCFKRHFLDNNNTDDTEKTIRDFAGGVLKELTNSITVGKIVTNPAKVSFVVGCPAGWSAGDRQRYRKILEDAGLCNVHIVSESRAAFVNASRFGSFDTSSVKSDILVIDMGSSTLDIAFLKNGNEYQVKTMGNPMLGGGILDEMIVSYALSCLKKKDESVFREIEGVLKENKGQKNKLMLNAREIKEQYFSDEQSCIETDELIKKDVRIYGNGKRYTVTLAISPQIVEDYLISSPSEMLDYQSFEGRIKNSLIAAHESIGCQPNLVILTGGASRMGFFRNICKQEFSESAVIYSETPEYDISRGLAVIGYTDDRMNALIKDVKEYVNGDELKRIVDSQLITLIDSVSAPVVDAVLSEVIKPSFEKWKQCKYVTLNDFQKSTNLQVRQFLKSGSVRKLIEEHSANWLSDIAPLVQADFDKICSKNNIDCNYLQIDNIYIPGNQNQDIDFGIGFVQALEGIAGLITVTVTAMLCGGTGIALLASGPAGLILGMALGLSIFAIGNRHTGKFLKDRNYPPIMRKIFLTGDICSIANRRKILAAIRKSMLSNASLTNEILSQIKNSIEKCLCSMSDDLNNRL